MTFQMRRATLFVRGSRSFSNLVSAVAVRSELQNLRVFDCSWFLNPARNGKAEFLSVGHIPTSVFFDIDEVSDKSTSLPHMLPSRSVFNEYCSSVGLQLSDRIVLYDSQFFSSFRVWWMFHHVFGHPSSVQVLDGGLPAWIAIGGELEKGPAKPRKR
jgi:thiosulfate/3-mercaptopyruvate sulfurtransferase